MITITITELSLPIMIMILIMIMMTMIMIIITELSLPSISSELRDHETWEAMINTRKQLPDFFQANKYVFILSTSRIYGQWSTPESNFETFWNKICYSDEQHQEFSKGTKNYNYFSLGSKLKTCGVGLPPPASQTRITSLPSWYGPFDANL